MKLVVMKDLIGQNYLSPNLVKRILHWLIFWIHMLLYLMLRPYETNGQFPSKHTFWNISKSLRMGMQCNQKKWLSVKVKLTIMLVQESSSAFAKIKAQITYMHPISTYKAWLHWPNQVRALTWKQELKFISESIL